MLSKNDCSLVHISGMVEIYRYRHQGIIFYHDTFFWCLKDNSDLIGPFDSKDLAMANYEHNLLATSNQSTQPIEKVRENVIHIDFVIKRRLS